MWQMPERRRLGTGENITRSGLTAHWDMRRRTSSVLPVINGEQLIVLMYVDKLVFSLLLRTPISSGPRNGEQPTQRRELLQHPICRLPLQPLHQPADCYLRRHRYQKVHVIFAHVPLQDVDVQSPTNLTDQIPDSMTDHSHQHRFAILRHPDQVQMDLEYAVRPMTVLVHGPILPQRNAEAFA